jgi:IS30 family transposase
MALFFWDSKSKEGGFMPKKYHHLAYKQRCEIFAYKAIGKSNRAIALILGASPATIGRELRRNSHSNGEYGVDFAEEVSSKRIKNANTRITILTDKFKRKIENKLNLDWSPDQISGRLLFSSIRVSRQTIYRWIRKDRDNNGILFLKLREMGKKRYSHINKPAGKGLIPNRVDISERPEIIKTKTRMGDWEGDLIMGPMGRGAIGTFVDRVSKMTIIVKCPTKESSVVANAIIKRFKPLIGKLPMHTLTLDNGLEFADHERMTRELGWSIYFATPYHSWERPLSENNNKFLRQYFPKGMDLRDITSDQLFHAENRLNNRPRKVLNYLTPHELYSFNRGVALRM